MRPLRTYRIETDRLVIRCYKVSDTPLLKRAVDESMEHLRPWMPWIKFEPETVEAKAVRVQAFIDKYKSGEDFTLGIFSRDEKMLLGSTGLHNRLGGNALEIGYWLHKDHINRGLISETVQALCRVAFEIESIDRLEIHCDETNTASARVPEKCGFKLREVAITKATDSNSADRRTMIWERKRAEYLNLPYQFAFKAFDAEGREIGA